MERETFRVVLEVELIDPSQVELEFMGQNIHEALDNAELFHHVWVRSVEPIAS